ncbi:urease accessory protein UreD [Spirillospora sp. NBC_01491]|uniref:urease accessory protein UreD n=1 Tax=Spirillospora sp. NBC_01491 TaxID=2976007 RepID=UPI002E31F319|nr:urease accessory protein UreD [Spirillospora sp. NBC_01491]
MRLHPDHYTIERTPEPVTRYASVPDTLPVGSPGKVGLLELAFSRRATRTELTGHYQKTPLQIMQPLYYDPERPDMPFLLIMQSGGGVLQGDRYRIDVECGPDTAVHLTTQAAGKIYRMEADYASQLVNLTAGPGAYLEYLPDPTIPFKDSRFYQRTVLTADPSATVVLGETVILGRLARGERNDYAAFCTDLEVRAPDGRTLFADPLRLLPGGDAVSGRDGVGGRDGVTGPAVLGGHGVMASLFVVTRKAPADVVAAALHTALADTGLPAGASVLPEDSGAWARVLGAESPEVAAAMRAAWDAVRRLLIGVPAPDRRRS